VQEQTHREQALHIRAKLAEEFQTLTLLERELSSRGNQHIYERVRVDYVSVALGYLQHAMDALEMAARES
jgi:hypothetical protein